MTAQIRELCKKKVEQIEKANKYRNSLVQQRMEEKSLMKFQTCRFDIDKCPLLSKPGELYIQKLNRKNSPRSFNLFIEYNNPRSSIKSQSFSETNLIMQEGAKSQSRVNRAPKSCLRNIYPKTRYENQFDNLLALESIADIFIHFTLSNEIKIMCHSNFRALVK